MKTVREHSRLVMDYVRMTWNAAKDCLLMHRVVRLGGTYTEFYERRMDKRAEKVGSAVTGSPEHKGFQLEFLKSQGLKPDARFLDYGCGAAAAGVHLIQYLNAGRYTGVDISKKCLEIAVRRTVEMKLIDKQPRFVHLPGGSMEPLRGEQFDLIWAQSVFTHMPPDAIRSLLLVMPTILAPGASFYATFACVDKQPHRKIIKDFYYNVEFFLNVASDTGFLCVIEEDWVHPASKSDRLLRFSRLSQIS